MKRTKSILALLLCIVTLLSLVACDTGKTPADGTDSGSESGTEATNPDEKLVLFENGKWAYEIIRSDVWSAAESRVALELKNGLRDVTDESPKLKNDFKRPEESYDLEAPEILFGATAYDATRETYKTLGFGEAEVKVVGKKIVLAAYTEEALEAVQKHFEKICSENFKDGKIEVLAGQLAMKTVVDEEANQIQIPSEATFSSTENCGLDQSLLIFKNGTEDIFNRYVSSLKDVELVNEHEQNGNFFKAYQMGPDQLNVSYTPYNTEIRVIISKNVTATQWYAKTEVTAKCTPMVIMHGLGWNNGVNGDNNGMCFLIRLEDGRFLVVDGGFNRGRDASDLYDLLVKYTPKGMKPTVAAWFITHAHSDHNGMFNNKWISSYKDKVKVESLIFNPPASTINTGTEGGNYLSTISIADNLGAKFVRCHTGDKYYIGGAEITMLYTVDTTYPKQFEYYNTCSHIFSVKIGGQTIVITGDGANSSFGHVQKMFGETLKADILQVAHHGYGTGVSDSAATDIMKAYSYISPSLVLWPISEYGYNYQVKNKVYNQHLVNLPSVKQVVVAEAKDHVFELPYTAKSSK